MPIDLLSALRLQCPFRSWPAVNDPIGCGTFSIGSLAGLLADFSQIDDFAHRRSVGLALGHGPRVPYPATIAPQPLSDSEESDVQMTVFFSFLQDTVS